MTSQNTPLDVVGIGNAIVDVIARADEAFLADQNLAKGSMHLIDEGRAVALYDLMGAATESSGGSAGNTIAGLASLGSKAGFVGKVANDQLGQVFAHDIRAQGVAFDTAPLNSGAQTARCLILVTPDGERTMNTFLGAAQALAPSDIDQDLIASAQITYLEGYLWDPDDAKQAFVAAAQAAHAAGREVALTLSDAFCVERFRGEFLELMRTATVDLVFANEHEVRALYETSDVDGAIDALGQDVPMAAVTRSADGSTVIQDGTRIDVPAFAVEKIVDLTGAGDQYAAGFLHGRTRGATPEQCARLGALAASEVIGHVGGRPATNLSRLAQQHGLDV
jgi:sugar/nucleoside kinase (ribokinase family)